MTDPLLVAGGCVVSDGVRLPADVLLRDGRVAAVGAPGELDARGARTLSAAGCLVMPGAVDAHTHVFGAPEPDGIAALCGGTTSALVFVDAEPGDSPAQAARRGIERELPASPIDLGFHGVIWEPAAYRSGDLAALADTGVTSIKLWLAYRELGIMADDDQLHAIMAEAAEEGVLVMAHCENGPVVAALAERLRAAGNTALSEHGRARPIALEAEAVHRFLAIAGLTGADAYVVHVTGAAPLQEIRRARERGQRVFAEACAHHLVLDERVYAGADPIRFMVTPPLRAPGEPDALWSALAARELDTYASDHGHVPLAPDKLDAAGDVTAVPYGLPGIQWRLALGYTFGVRTGRLGIERLVEVACAAPAKVFGLFPRKGTLAPGADADVVVWDPELRTVVGPETRRDGMDYSPYDGLELTGGARAVVAGGELVVQDGEFLGRAGAAAFLARPRRSSGKRVSPARNWVSPARRDAPSSRSPSATLGARSPSATSHT
jgi:dihydropyrimidinase